MRRRGQITLFVIIGLAVLLLVGIFLLWRSTSEPASLAGTQAAASVTALVESCLEQTARDALITIGLGGGYTPEQLRTFTTTGADASAIEIEPQAIPYWHHIGACDQTQGCIVDARPSLCDPDTRRCPLVVPGTREDISFERNIETLTAQALPGCTGDFGSVPDVLVRANTIPEVDATIRDGQVDLHANWDLTLTAADKTEVDLDAFNAQLMIDLPTIYTLATRVYIEERQRAFLEEIFLQFLSVYGGIDSPIPPIKDIQLHGSKRFWITRNVRSAIEDGIMPFFAFVQVANAMESYTPIRSPGVDDALQPYASGIYEYLTIKTGEEVYPLGVRFAYPGTGLDVRINDQEILKPKELPGADFLSIINIKFLEYKFRYDVRFPIHVRITDPYAFNGAGFDLDYALEANIRKNRPVNTSADVTVIATPDESVDLADPTQLVNHEYRVIVTDHRTGGPIEDAAVTYVCGVQFQMGATDTEGTWAGRLPFCAAGGTVLVEHSEYGSTGVAQDNTEEDRGKSDVRVALWPRANKRIELWKRSPANIAAGTGRTELDGNDSAIVTLQRRKLSPYDDEVPRVGILEFGTPEEAAVQVTQRQALETALGQGSITQEEYDAVLALQANQVPSEPEEPVLDLIPGTYDITVFLTYYGLIQIPMEQRCGGNIISNECVTLDAQNFTVWNTGGAVLTDADAIELTEEFVYSDRPLVLYALEQTIPRNWTALERYQSLEAYQSYDRRVMIQPET